jgi:hypothetical protein
MRRTWKGVVALAALLIIAGAKTAEAHELACEKTVNGVTEYIIPGYPAALDYELTVINTHPNDTSDVDAAEDPLLAMYGFSFTPAPPFSIPVGQSVTDSFQLPVQDEQACLRIAAADGRPDRYIQNTFTVTWDGGTYSCSASVYCPPAPQGSGATRTLGFFKTHEQALQQCLASGPIDLGFVEISTLEEALGLLWGRPARFADGTSRGELDRARFLLGRQTLVGLCNQRLFGTAPTPSDLLVQAVNALSGTRCSLMLALESQVTAFNEGGDDEALPGGFVAGPSTPRHAESIAVDPTSPSGGSCTP